MVVPHLLKIYFGLGWPSSVLEIVSSQRLKRECCNSWLFIYFRKYWNLRNIKLIEKLSRRHLINSSDVFVIKGFTVYNKTRHSYIIYMLRIAGQTAGPNGHSWEFYRLKNSKFFFIFKKIFFKNVLIIFIHGQRQALQLVIFYNWSFKYYMVYINSELYLNV